MQLAEKNGALDVQMSGWALSPAGNTILQESWYPWLKFGPGSVPGVFSPGSGRSGVGVYVWLTESGHPRDGNLLMNLDLENRHDQIIFAVYGRGDTIPEFKSSALFLLLALAPEVRQPSSSNMRITP
ncbi:hypothetical protein AGABI1DRAFT_90452 [Agaricus bisporus var. burnettii JB137-S8]|uniref:Uncharacterized protein n=1 Tax=Agaricus bisporus var. burnettii (strain JB137-S8 / ATCC MYA-4627 / FGSC 10392) TaxID=597362 RepID=K5XFL1_AGABU|nr:uncharacterized protein AGABI1DRAFT_90452 [Agaricus bisporus var. burnettii JB137-S8]EKM82188.1 hypothetical protein AGABI1DRAFT_90452 [Agaricus bisporus var. burnettii JB137-S8]